MDKLEWMGEKPVAIGMKVGAVVAVCVCVSGER